MPEPLHGDSRDAELIRSAVGGEPEAFRQLVEKYQRPLFDLAARVLQDETEAEDVVQEAFWRFYRNLARFRLGASLSSWLYTITLNLCRNRMRRKKIIRFLSLDFTPPDEERLALSDILPDPKGGNFELDEGQASEMLDRFIRFLPDHLRGPFVLRYAKSLSDQEIASILNITVNHVRVLISRAKSRLWKKFGKELSSGVIRGPGEGT